MSEKAFVPLYRKIYLDLKMKIASSELAPGQKLPYERELCDQYGVKRVTIRKSLEMLAQEGLITKRMGLGSFVAGESAPAAAVNMEPGATILFIMRRNENDIYHNTSSCNTRIFFEAEQICRRNGYLLSYVGLDEETSIMDIVRDHPVSGVFLVSSYHEKTIKELMRMKMPVVLLNHYDPRLLSVMPDNQHMLSLVVGYLAEMNHRRIAYVDGMPDSRNAQERWEAFRFAMLEHGLDVDPELYVVGNWTFEGGRIAARELLKRDHLPTAVFAASDMMAAGVMEELRSAGLKIPDDISVVGYDNLDIDMLLSPPLSSATVDFKHMCEVAFEHLKMVMEKGDREMDHYVIRMPASLIRRESVACPAGNAEK
ncbi:MAG: GntR family transcriptional regulator [Clostridia bacterium]|nr:GntR family transcriptional regulator [Clostridia bacterium]